MHGKTSPIHHDGRGVFAGLSNPFEATRYHTLVITRETFPNPDFEVTPGPRRARSWACATGRSPLHGVQFHPESFLTPEGPALLAAFLAKLNAGLEHMADPQIAH